MAVRHFDHLTIVVREVERAKAFFAVLGFKEAVSVVIKGPVFADYMGVPGIEAEHVTLVLENASPRTEVQLLRYLNPDMSAGSAYPRSQQARAEPCLLRGGRHRGRGGAAARRGLQDAQRDHGFSRAKAGVCRGPRRRDDRTVTVARG